MSHTTPQCAIAGCTLRASAFGDNHLNGDLFKLGDVYIFHGNAEELHPGVFVYPREVVLQDGADFFHRRHVLVFHASQATFNEAAVEYMR